MTTLIRLSECTEAQLDWVLGNLLGIGPITRWRMPRPIPHGTRNGAAQERRRGLAVCGPCLAAETAHKAAWTARQR